MSTIRNRISLWNLTFIMLLSNKSILGQNYADSKMDSLIRRGIDLSIQHEYEQAERIFQQMIADEPEYPAGYFFMAAAIQCKMMDYETDQWEQDFHCYIQLAIRAAKTKPAETRSLKETRSLFYEGCALCYLAFYEARKDDYLTAVRHGLSGISTLNNITKSRPDFFDAYFGIGSYKYWRSQLTRYWNWLPILSDEREQGIQMVRLAVEKGSYVRYPAMNELIWILLNAGQPEEAYAWALSGLEQFPRSRFFLWGAAKSTFALDNYPAAIEYFQQLLISITSAPVNNHFNEFICRLNLALCFEKTEQYAEAMEQITILESLTPSQQIEHRLKKQQKQLTQLKKRLVRMLVENQNRTDDLVTEHQPANKQSRQNPKEIGN